MNSSYAPTPGWWDARFPGYILGDLIQAKPNEQVAHSTPRLNQLGDEDTATEVRDSSANPVEDQSTEDSMVTGQTKEKRASAEQAMLTLRRLLRGLEGVEGILAGETPEGITVSVITNNPSRARRREIYDCEWDLMQHYPGTGFDFRLIDRRGQLLCNVVSVEDADIYLRL